MLFSTTNLTSSPQLLSSSSHNLYQPSPLLPPFIRHEHHCQHDLSQGWFSHSCMQETDVGVSNFLPLAGNKSVKKDRHSKINTAQGLRDRRVRLSIDISRKFFDLQDLLGFDKASKTIEWLLTKSKDSIKDLIDKSFSPTSEHKMVPKIEQLVEVKGKSLEDESRKKASFHLAAKELRAKARARARERTRKKLSGATNFHFSSQLRYLNPLEVCDKFGSSSSHQLTKQKPTKETIGKMIKCANSIHYNNNFSNLPPNWDIGTSMDASGFMQLPT